MIFTGSHVKEVKGGKQAHVVTSSGYTVRADHLVVATNTPVNDIFATHTKQAPYRTYVIACEIPAGSVQRALFWDTLDPYHFVRVQPGPRRVDYLIVGGEDHKTGQANDAGERFYQLETWARKHFPMIFGIPFRWSGQIIETVDGIAFIGRNPMDAENVYIATGDSGMGMTHGTIAGMLISDLIMGRENRWTELYSPSRRRAGAIKEFARENLNVAARYSEYVSPGDLSDEADLPNGCGAIIREGVRKLAVYRDETGSPHKFSAICPHLKCIVHWNSLEKTWDCPCHGSRFTAEGEVLNGPAISNLSPVEEPAHAQ
jgi:Rieske Fe-S protein